MIEIAALIFILLLSPAIGLLLVSALLALLPAWLLGLAWRCWRCRDE